LSAALATPAAAQQCDRQALETARTLELLGDREVLQLHLRSYCPEMFVPPSMLYGAPERRHGDIDGAHSRNRPDRDGLRRDER
jgi:hypothetical protein